MHRIKHLFRGAGGSGPPRRAARPSLEGLEDRMLLYATYSSGTWQFAQRISYSFLPDGTNIGGYPSNLYSTMNKAATTAAWQGAFEEAAALWSSYAKVNLALVPDGGQALGITGNQQDDSRFGDIRVGMTSTLGADTLATTFQPPSANGGTIAGDILFNSNIYWTVNGGPGWYDFETVALHELGHALGLAHSSVANAVMQYWYQGRESDLTADDQAGDQALFGAYGTDPSTNQRPNTAINLTPTLNSTGQGYAGYYTLYGPGSADWFSVTVPQSTNGTMTISMQSTGLSSVSPQLLIVNSGVNTMLGQSTVNSYGGTATVTVNGVRPGTGYYIKAMGASNLGWFGAYGLLLNFNSNDSQAPLPPPNTYVAWQMGGSGGGSNDTVGPGGSGSSDNTGSGGGQGTKGAKGFRSVVQDGEQSDGTVKVGTIRYPGDALHVAPGYRPTTHHSPIGPIPWSETAGIGLAGQTRTVVVNLNPAGAPSAVAAPIASSPSSAAATLVTPADRPAARRRHPLGPLARRDAAAVGLADPTRTGVRPRLAAPTPAAAPRHHAIGTVTPETRVARRLLRSR